MSRGRSRLSRRDSGVDLARGLAVCSMVVAHTSPSGVDLPTEYLTAPLFAVLIGVGLALARQRDHAWEQGGNGGQGGEPALVFALHNLWRGIVLIVLGRLLQSSYPFIDVVLQTLGVLTIVLAPLVALLGRRPRVALAAAALMALTSPVMMAASREWLAERPLTAPWLRDLIGWLAAGEHYRTTSDLAFGLTGVALAGWLHGAGSPRLVELAPVTVPGLAALTLLAYGGGRIAGMDTHPYSGSSAEIVGSCAFAAGTVIACCWLSRVLPRAGQALGPLVATGRMALTAYALQILLLAGLYRAVGPGFDDNDWMILTGLTVVILAVCWAWMRWVRRPGPLEAVLRVPRLLSRANAEE